MAWRDSFIRIVTRKQVLGSYHAFAEGRATKEDADRILNDLARESNFFKTHGGDKFEEGKRSLFLYMTLILRMKPDETQHYASREWRDDDRSDNPEQ